LRISWLILIIFILHKIIVFGRRILLSPLLLLLVIQSLKDVHLGRIVVLHGRSIAIFIRRILQSNFVCHEVYFEINCFWDIISLSSKSRIYSTGSSCILFSWSCRSWSNRLHSINYLVFHFICVSNCCQILSMLFFYLLKERCPDFWLLGL
jgi:hypothetical protein